MGPEPAVAAEVLVTAPGDVKSSACRPRHAANSMMPKSRTALEPMEAKSNAIDEPMLENGQNPCKENVVLCGDLSKCASVSRRKPARQTNSWTSGSPFGSWKIRLPNGALGLSCDATTMERNKLVCQRKKN